jgi:hypothetical protein
MATKMRTAENAENRGVLTQATESVIGSAIFGHQLQCPMSDYSIYDG